MIHSFRCSETRWLFTSGKSKLWGSAQPAAVRKLDLLDSAVKLGDLRIPPGNRLEALRGNRDGQYSIRINNKWRICFLWHEDGPHEVEIVDSH